MRGTGYNGEEQVLAVREEPRIAEQQFGNFQDFGDMRASKVSTITRTSIVMRSKRYGLWH